MASSQKDFHLGRFPQIKMCQINILSFFTLGWKVEDSDLTYLFEETTTFWKTTLQPFVPVISFTLELLLSPNIFNNYLLHNSGAP